MSDAQYVVVPREPTEAMVEAGLNVWFNADGRGGSSLSRAIYRAMIAATQQAVSPPEGVGWRPIETAPKDGTAILAAHADYDDGIMDCVLWSSGRWETMEGYGYMDGRFSHWMPLPPAPDASQDQGSSADADTHRNAADGGSSNEGGEA